MEYIITNPFLSIFVIYVISLIYIKISNKPTKKKILIIILILSIALFIGTYVMEFAIIDYPVDVLLEKAITVQSFKGYYDTTGSLDYKDFISIKYLKKALLIEPDNKKIKDLMRKIKIDARNR